VGILTKVAGVGHERQARTGIGPLPPPPSRGGMIVSAVVLTQLLVVIDFFALNLALPSMARDFEVAPTDLQLVISGYMIALGAFMIPAGRVADIFGRRRVTAIGIAVFGVSSLVCAAAPNEVVVVLFRFVQGIGAALCFPVSIALVTATFPRDRVQRTLGLVYGLAAVGQALGPLVGGLLSEISWRWVFVINAPLSALALTMLLRAVPETRDETASHHIDVVGIVFVSFGLISTTFAVDNADEWGWGSPRTLLLLSGGVVLLAAFVGWELKTAQPLLDLGLLRDRVYAVIVVGGTVANCAYCVAVFGATLYLQEVRGLGPARSALVFLVLAVGAAAAGQLAGHLERALPQWVISVALATGGIGLLIMTSSSSWLAYLPGFALVGVGLGLGWAYSSVATQVVVPPAEAAAAAGLTLTSLVAVGGVAVAAAATAIDELAGGAVVTVDPIDDVVRISAVACLVMAVLTPVLGRIRHTDGRMTGPRARSVSPHARPR
jgi:MFS family permease